MIPRRFRFGSLSADHTTKPAVNYLGRFWASLASLAAVAGLYVAARPIHLTDIFWVVVGLAVLITGARPTLHAIGDLVLRIRNYPGLLRRVAQLEETRALLEGRERSSSEEIAAAKKVGRDEALAEVRGAILAEAGDLPELIGISNEEGSIALVGKVSENSRWPRIGARYAVYTFATGNYRGAVEVSRLESATQLVWMRCVDPSTPEFWQHLVARVNYDDSAPGNVVLRPFEVDLELSVADTQDVTTSRQGATG